MALYHICWVCVGVIQNVQGSLLICFMAQPNLTVLLISAPDLRRLIRNHVLEKNDQNGSDKGVEAQKSHRTSKTIQKTWFYSGATHPLNPLPKVYKRSSGRGKAQRWQKCRWLVLYHRIICKYTQVHLSWTFLFSAQFPSPVQTFTLIPAEPTSVCSNHPRAKKYCSDFRSHLHEKENPKRYRLSYQWRESGVGLVSGDAVRRQAADFLSDSPQGGDSKTTSSFCKTKSRRIR